MPATRITSIIELVESPFTLLAGRRSAAVGLALLAEAGVLAALAFAEPAEVVGIPAAVVAAIAGTVAVVVGPWDGAFVAFAGAVVFVLVGDRGAGELAVLVVWPAVVVVVGLFARRVASRGLALRRIVAAHELERQQLALQLHDETAQTLAAALMTLNRVEGAGSPAEAGATSAELRGLIHETIEKVRALAVELRPKALDDFGLEPAVERLAATFSERTGVAVEVAMGTPAGRLPAETEVVLYRVVQEALKAVAGRPGVEHVRLALSRTPGGAVLEVTDDGRARESDGGVWPDLVSTRERLRLVGGRLSIVSDGETGTTVRATVPT
jgi:two-component system sensor histidine kinase UhpB